MTQQPSKTVFCFVTGSAGDWGGASRVLNTNLPYIDRSRIEPILLLPRDGPTEPGDQLAFVRTLRRAVLLFRREKVQFAPFKNRPWRPTETIAARPLCIPILLPVHVITDTLNPVIGWAYGKPVIATLVGGLPEIMEDGRTGRRCAPDPSRHTPTASNASSPTLHNASKWATRPAIASSANSPQSQ